MLSITPKKGDLIYIVTGLNIQTDIVISIRNDITSSILMLSLNAQKGSDTYKLTELFKKGLTNTKEYYELFDRYKNLYTDFYGINGIRLNPRYFYKLKDAREQVKLNKIDKINKLKKENIELQESIDKNLAEIKKLSKEL